MTSSSVINWQPLYEEGAEEELLVPNTFPTPVVQKSSVVPYLFTIAFMALLILIGGLAIVFLRPDKDNTTLIAVVTGSLVATTTGLLAIMKSQETHQSVNGRLDALMKTSNASAYEKGVKDTSATMGVAVAALIPSQGVVPGQQELKDRLAKLEALLVDSQQQNRMEVTGEDTNARVQRIESEGKP